MKNSEAFLDSFAAIEKYLRSFVSAGRSRSFYQLVEMRGKKVPGVFSDSLLKEKRFFLQ